MAMAKEMPGIDGENAIIEMALSNSGFLKAF